MKLSHSNPNPKVPHIRNEKILNYHLIVRHVTKMFGN